MMRVSLICAIILSLSGCHKAGDMPIVCFELSTGARHQSLIEVSRSLSKAGFWKIENSLPSAEGDYPNIGLYRLDGTKVYLVGERTDDTGVVWPPATISFYGNSENPKLREWIFLTLDLLEKYALKIEQVCGAEEAKERAQQYIDEWNDENSEISFITS